MFDSVQTLCSAATTLPIRSRDERNNADETVRREREEHARSLQKFLPLERESTDRFLRSERMHSDDALGESG